MDTAPKSNGSFFSMAAWYAMVAPLAAAAISSIGWLILVYSDQGSAWSIFDSRVAFTFLTADFILLTSVLASIVCLFGLRRHGWRVIVWKSLAGFCLSLLVFAAPPIYLRFHPLVIQVAHMQNPAAMRVDVLAFNTQDFAVKGEEMVDSLLGPPSPQTCVLDKAAQHPAVIAIGRIINNTTLYIDTDLLMKKIGVRLNNSGKAITDTTGGALNNVDFTFSGKIIQPDNARAGNKTQRTYIFQLSLTDSRGLSVWEDEKQVAKNDKLPAVDPWRNSN